MISTIIFCSFQPCARTAEGDIVLEYEGREQRFPVCPRHYEYILNNSGISPSTEVIFSDEVPGDLIIPSDNQIVV